MILSVCHLGPTPYREALALQEGLVSARASGTTGDWLLYPDHSPVLTIGRGGNPESLIADAATLKGRGIELFEVARGGDVTWHGPGQLVGYLIADLSRHGRDLHRFLRDLEQSLIEEPQVRSDVKREAMIIMASRLTSLRTWGSSILSTLAGCAASI